MSAEDSDQVPSPSEGTSQSHGSEAGEADVSTEGGPAEEAAIGVDAVSLPPLLPEDFDREFGSVWSDASKSYRPTLWELAFLARKWAEVFFECRWMSFATGCSQKIWPIANGKLAMLAEELGEDVVDRIHQGVEEQERRRMGGVAWDYFLKGDTDGYEEWLLRVGGANATVSKALIGELRRLVASRFPELSVEDLSLAMFCAADKATLETLPMPTCDHVWQRTSLALLRRPDREPFEQCAVCGALRESRPS